MFASAAKTEAARTGISGEFHRTFFPPRETVAAGKAARFIWKASRDGPFSFNAKATRIAPGTSKEKPESRGSTTRQKEQQWVCGKKTRRGERGSSKGRLRTNETTAIWTTRGDSRGVSTEPRRISGTWISAKDCRAGGPKKARDVNRGWKKGGRRGDAGRTRKATPREALVEMEWRARGEFSDP